MDQLFQGSGDTNTTQRLDQIRLMSTNLCVATVTPTGALGEPLKLQTCSTIPNA